MTQTPPGWYDDGTGTQRWFDGQQWTRHVAPQVAIPPQSVPAAPAAAPVEPTVAAATPNVVPVVELPVVQPGDGRGRGRGRRRTTAFVTASLVIVAALAGTGAYAYAQLAPSGTQPEAVVPGDAVAFVKVDFDPSAGQKIAAARLIDKLPHSGGLSAASGWKNQLLSQLFSGTKAWGLNYSTDIEPWLGNRAAVAVLPYVGSSGAADANTAPDFVAIVATTNTAATTTTLTRVQAKAPGLSWVFTRGYVVIAPSAATLSRYQADLAAGSLAQSPTYRTDRSRVPSGEVAVAWADLAGLSKYSSAATGSLTSGSSSSLSVVPGSTSTTATSSSPSTPPATGQLIMGLHLTPSSVDLDGQVVNGHASALATTAGLANLTTPSLLPQMPATSSVALDVPDLGPLATAEWSTLTARSGGTLGGIDPQAQLGLNLPSDLTPLLGTQTAVAVIDRGPSQQPQFVLRASTPDPAASVAVVDKLLTKFAPQVAGANVDVKVAQTPTGYVLTTGGAPTDTGLGATSGYQEVLPKVADASVSVYANVSALLAAEGQASSPWSAITNVGASTQADGSFSVHVSVS